MKPNYNKFYTDIVNLKFPEKKQECEFLLNKEELSVMEILLLNKIIFNTDNASRETNQKHRSYQKSDILQILDYQKKHNLNNTQLAKHFKLSRNTVTKWKKLFLIK